MLASGRSHAEDVARDLGKSLDGMRMRIRITAKAQTKLIKTNLTRLGIIFELSNLNKALYIFTG